MTANKGLNKPVVGSTGWGDPLNDNADYIDAALGSFATVTGTSGDITLTTDQVRVMCLKSDTGAFLSDVTYIVPSAVGGQWIVQNQSASNAYNLIVKNAASGNSVSIANGQTRLVYSDGTKTFFSNDQSAFTSQSLQIGSGFVTAAASCVGTNATVTFSGGYIITVGQVISIKGVTPAGYNGVWTVTASSAGSVTFVVPATLTAQTVAGNLYYGAISGSTLNLSNRGSLSGLATQAEAVAGTDNTTLMTPLRVSQVKNIGIGAGQTWQNVASSRANDTNYVNSTDRAIMVNVSYLQASANTSTMLVDGITVATGRQSNIAGGQLLSAIVPSASTYKVVINGGNGFSTWAELR